MKRVLAVCKVLCLLAIISLQQTTVFAQEYAALVDGKILSKAQLVEDYDILYRAIINYHPVPYDFISEADLKAHVDAQKAAFPDSLSEREFYLIAKKLQSLIRCGHSSGRLSHNWYQIVRGKSVLLPFSIFRSGSRVFIQRKAEEELPFAIGDELLSINGVSVEQLLQEMDDFQGGDGNIQSYVHKATALNFRGKYLFLYGDQDTYAITYKNEAGEEQKAELTSSKSRLDPLPKLPLPDQLAVEDTTSWSVFALDTVNQLAYLRIRSFMGRKGYEDYYDRVFTALQQRPNYPLIIDLRNNTGGFFMHGNAFLTYFIPEPFEFNFRKSKRKREKVKELKLDKWSALTKFAFSTKPSVHKSKEWKTHTFRFKPAKTQFQGKVHVITNGFTASQASLAAANLMDYGATYYGTETGGGASSTNAIISYQLVLPHSEFKAMVPHFQILSNSTKAQPGRGVIPDYELTPSLDRTEDKLLQEVLELVGR